MELMKRNHKLFNEHKNGDSIWYDDMKLLISVFENATSGAEAKQEKFKKVSEYWNYLSMVDQLMKLEEDEILLQVAFGKAIILIKRQCLWKVDVN